MPLVLGQHVLHPSGGAVTPALTPALNAFAVDLWPPSIAQSPLARPNTVGSHLPVMANPRRLSGMVARSYQLDYYHRVHVRPASIVLGNVITAQQRAVTVWNAWLDRALTLTEIGLEGLDGIVLEGQGSTPLVLQTLQELSWTITIGLDGSPTMDGSIIWRFDADAAVSVPVTGNRITAWSFMPNWDGGITERLEWLTLVERGTNGNETSTPLREYPRRSWEFVSLADSATRQRMEALLYDASARTWAMPVFTDQTVLAAGVSVGATAIGFNTTALDYAAGALAILIGNALNFEVVQVDTVTAGGITLKQATQGTWAAGTRLFPMHLVRLEDWPQLNRYTSNVLGADSVRFVAVDTTDWSAQMPAPQYRGQPVLEMRPEWSEDPQVQYARDVELIDCDTGVVLVDDVTGLPWPTQSQRWQLYGRADRDSFRRLLYGLQGQVGYLWLPTWADDLTPVADLAGNDASLQVKWHGYTNYLHQQPGRRDIRIELADGTVLYRRITSSIEVSSSIEQLGMDAPWPSTIPVGNVVRVSYMALCRLNADAVEIQHLADIEGAAACSVTFAQVTGNG